MDERPEHCLDEQQLVDLALGETTGRERGDELGHVLGCPRCRAELAELIDTAERLLLAAPQAEPPPGFETAVIAELISPPTAAPVGLRAWRRALTAAAAIVLVLSSVALGRWLADDGAGSVEAAPMVTPAGRIVGRAWVQDDDPSWILVSVPDWAAWDTGDGQPTYTLEVLLADGSTAKFEEITLRDDGSWSTTTPLDAASISEIAIVDRAGRTWCRAEFA